MEFMAAGGAHRWVGAGATNRFNSPLHVGKLANGQRQTGTAQRQWAGPRSYAPTNSTTVLVLSRQRGDGCPLLWRQQISVPRPPTLSVKRLEANSAHIRRIADAAADDGKPLITARQRRRGGTEFVGRYEDPTRHRQPPHTHLE